MRNLWKLRKSFSTGRLAMRARVCGHLIKNDLIEIYLLPHRFGSVAELQASQGKCRDSDATYDRTDDILGILIKESLYCKPKPSFSAGSRTSGQEALAKMQ